MTQSPAATLPARHAPARPPAAVQALALAEPLPGFPGHRDYVLVPAEDGGRLFWLQSMAPDGPRFLAGRAASFFPDYAPALPGAVCLELGLEDAARGRAVLPPDRARTGTSRRRRPTSGPRWWSTRSPTRRGRSSSWTAHIRSGSHCVGSHCR